MNYWKYKIEKFDGDFRVIEYNDNLLNGKDSDRLKNMVLEVYQTTPLEILCNLDFNAYDFINHDNILSQKLKKLQMKQIVI